MDDVQISSWWEIPCIAHFCSLFRLYFDLIDFDIEELEEALLTDSVEEVASSFLQDLIVQLLKGCFNSQQDEITTSNNQMYLRRIFRKKCEEGSTKDNPFETDAAFHSLPLRTKVKILYDLCDFRLDNEDVPESLKSLESDSLRVEPLGRDSGGSTYWYFYGTRLYREDYGSEKQGGGVQKRARKDLHHGEKAGCTKWQVVCYTEEDWQVLTRKFKNCKSIHEKNLHRTLSADFLPELPRLFAEKERLQRKRMLEQQLRRSGRTILSEPNQREQEMPVLSQHKASNNNNSNSSSNSSSNNNPNSKQHISSEEGGSSDMEEDELHRQREEQEKADRLLAEEIEREERKARLHLRERRGGGAVIPPSSSTQEKSFSSSSRSGSSSNKKRGGGGSRSSSATSKSPSKSPSKSSPIKKNKGKEGKRKKKPGSSGRTTNNSLASSIQGAVLSKGATKDQEEDEEEDEEVDCDDNVNDDDDDDDEKEEEEAQSDQEVDERSRSTSPITSSSSSAVKKTPKKNNTGKPKKKNSEALLDKEKRSKSKDKLKDKDRKRKKIKKDKSKDRGEKDGGKVKTKQIGKGSSSKSSFDTNHVSASVHHSMSGMSKAKVKSSVLFSQSDEDVQIGMHKVIESIKNHGDAWPFMNAVDEDYAPNYYRVISSPMDVQTMEDKLDNQEYVSLEEFIADFQRIVDNCIKYNGPSSEYTEMAETLQEAFNKLIQRYIVPDESDEEISIEYNNVGAEKKRSKPHTHSKKDEHKKENESSTEKIKSPKVFPPKSKPNKSSSEKRNKVDKKSKHKLMQHHRRDSETNEKLGNTTGDTLKDFDKWLNYDDAPKPTEFVSSGAAAFDNLRNRILEDDNDRDTNIKHNNNNNNNTDDNTTNIRSGSPVAGHKRKAEGEITKVRPTYITKSKPNPKKRDYDDEVDEDFTPPKKMAKKSENKHSASKSDKSKSEKIKQNKKSSSSTDAKTKKNSDNNKEKRSGGKVQKEKEKMRGKISPSSSNKHRHNSGVGGKNSSSSGKRDSSSPTNGPVSSKGKKKSFPDRHASSKDDYFNNSSPTSSGDSPPSEKPALKHSKIEDKKHSTKAPVKRANSLFNTIKGPGSIKKHSQVNNKNMTKVNSTSSFHAESKFNKLSNSLDTFTPGESVDKVGSLGRENSMGGGEKPEKKKCLLLNDNSTDRVGGPKLSLGTLLSTDAIKLGEFKKSGEDYNEEDDDEDMGSKKSGGGIKKLESNAKEGSSEGNEKVQSKKEGNKEPMDSSNNNNNNSSSSKESAKQLLEVEEEEEETDRKLEPSKGFKPEKCMPNLSAWIKAFGGPTKPTPGSGPAPDAGSMPNSHHGRKVDNDPKSFKVMGRGVADSSSGPNNDSKQSSHHPHHHQPHKHSPVPKALIGSKHGVHHNEPPPLPPPPHWNSSASSSQAQQHKSGDHLHPQVVNLSEEMSSSSGNNNNHSGMQHHKKHRHRKMSTSSLSSQSESGSPQCFNSSNADGGNPGGINPPRWVDEAWTHSHQSQSPSASSQVSSQSPANSPFSPVINSPPHTPQTPPRLPVGGPVRVGFYQDLTSQHSSPEKINEPHSNSNSNIASPSTPPTPTNNNNNSTHSHSRGRDTSGSSNNNNNNNNSSNKGSGGLGGGPYPTPAYAPRYAASTPSPNVGGPGSNNNMQSPSPGGMVNSVESPPGNPNSPHSPNVSHGSVEYRPPSYNNNNSNNNNQQQSASNSQSSSSSSGGGRSTAPPPPPVPTAIPAHSHHRPSSLGHHGGSHSPSIPPYPPPNNHHYHGHPEAAHSNPSISQAHQHQHPQPVMAHMNHQVQAHSQMSHQQHYDRYPPHNYHHHQMNHVPSSSSISSSSSLPPSSSVYSQNLTAAHSQRPSTAQPSPYPTNPYASNPRSINIPPNVYNNPMSSDSVSVGAISRFYKPTSVGGGELSLTSTTATSDQHNSNNHPSSSSSSSSTSSTSRGRSSRSSVSAAAAAASEQQEMQSRAAAASAANLEGKLGHGDLGNGGGFQWPHNLASLSQIVNSIPNPMNAVGMANAYRQYDQAMAESMSKYQQQQQQQQQRSDPTGYGAVSGSSGGSSKGGTPLGGLNPPAAHSQQADKLPSDNNNSDGGSGGVTNNSRGGRTKGESKSSRSQSSKNSGGGGGQSMVPGSAFNFSSLSPADLALYPPKEMSEGSLYSASPSPSLAHRPDLYPSSTSSFHASFSSSSRTTAGGVPTPSISPYQIPPFIGSHPSPYQSQSSQPFAHSQPPRGLVDPYQQFFQSSPHVMGLLPPTGYPYPHGLGFNRPGWI